MEKRKMTKREYFGVIKDLLDDFLDNGDTQKNELLDFIEHEIELLDKKSSRHTETKTQKANIELMSVIVAELERINRPVSVTELQNESPALKTYTNQKISALLKKLVDEGTIERDVSDKKKTVFKITALD